MTESTTAAPVATTEVSATAVETNNTVQEQPGQVEATTVGEETKVESAAPDYSFVPKKFLKDGTPDLEGLSKSYQALEKKLGQKGLVVPEDVAEYQWEQSAPLQLNEEAINHFKTEAQKAGLSKEQYAFAMQKYEQVMTEAGFNPEASAALLQKEWGSEYQANLSLAKRAFEEFAPSDVSIDDPVMNHPTVIKILARLGSELREDSQLNTKGTRPSGMSKTEIDALRSDKDYWDNPEKQKAVSDWYAKTYR